MGKILDKSFRDELEDILIESGYKEKEAHKIVMCRYKKEVKEGAVKILEKVLSCLKEDKYEELLGMTEFSPSGDGYGRDNCYIDFSELGVDIEDIEDVVNILK